MLSRRIQPNIISIPVSSSLKRAFSDVFDASNNPNGIISMAIAENTLMDTELAEFLSTNMEITPQMFGYSGADNGPPSLIPGLVNLYNSAPFNPIVPVQAEHLHVAGGCTALLDQCFWALLDEGEGVLIGRPLYGGFIGDMSVRSKVQPIGVSLKGLDPFSAEAVRRYEEALLEAKNEGVKVKMLLLCTPHNPLGQYVRLGRSF
jgi:1-aminocyclopropane-1-carboxylate synthase